MSDCGFVAPRTGAWIETNYHSVVMAGITIVAPRTGAWIETETWVSQRAGLLVVAPRTGAWIETFKSCYNYTFAGRSPHGSVD